MWMVYFYNQLVQVNKWFKSTITRSYFFKNTFPLMTQKCTHALNMKLCVLM